MKNGYKLVLVVLGFFLALTFVRALDYSGVPSEVVFEGNAPAVLSFTIFNSSSNAAFPSIAIDGPVQLTQTKPASTRIAGKSSQLFELQLLPNELLGARETYKGQLRITLSSGERTFPISFSRRAAPFSFSGNAGAGLVGGVSFSRALSQTLVLNVVLALVALVLLIALLARLKNRV